MLTVAQLRDDARARRCRRGGPALARNSGHNAEHGTFCAFILGARPTCAAQVADSLCMRLNRALESGVAGGRSRDAPPCLLCFVTQACPI